MKRHSTFWMERARKTIEHFAPDIMEAILSRQQLADLQLRLGLLKELQEIGRVDR